jgi:hypothetical protein
LKGGPGSSAGIAGWTDKLIRRPTGAAAVYRLYIGERGTKAEALLLRTWRNQTSSRTKGPPLSYVSLCLHAMTSRSNGSFAPVGGRPHARVDLSSRRLDWP